jgi:hypothetical protein
MAVVLLPTKTIYLFISTAPILALVSNQPSVQLITEESDHLLPFSVKVENVVEL